MFIKQKHSYEIMNVMFKLAQDYIQESTPTSLIGAYKILSTLQENYPDKAYQASLGKVQVKLKDLGLLDQVLKEEEKKYNKDQNKTLTPNFTRSKL